MSATPEERFAEDGKVTFPIKRDDMKELQSAFHHFRSRRLPKKLNTIFGMARFTPWKRIAMGQVGAADETLFFLVNHSDTIEKLEFLEGEDGGISVVFLKEGVSL